MSTDLQEALSLTHDAYKAMAALLMERKNKEPDLKLYGFVRDGKEDSFTTSNLDEAKWYAKRGNYQLVVHNYRHIDTELIEDYTEADGDG